MKRLITGLMAFAVVAGMAACDAGPSAVLPDGHGAAPVTQDQKPPVWAEAASASPETQTAALAAPEAKTPKAPAQTGIKITDTRYGDWPLWSYNRNFKSIENAKYHFDKHGAEFGVKSYADWLGRVHGFIHSPPAGTQTLKRNNGDTLFYHPPSNTFAVMTKKGAPRTMFKPDSGADYWQKQKDIEAGRRTIRRDAGDTSGAEGE